jgi:CRP-like cAMP-binding protein
MISGLCDHFFTTFSFNENSTIQEQGRRVGHVDFVEAGLVSLRAIAAGSVIETGLIGRQGVSGASIVLGGRYATHQSRALTAGWSLRIQVTDLLRMIEHKPSIRDHILSYVEALMIHGSQMALCGARHSTDERLATWMCLASNALNSSVLPITHEHLSINLGLRRAGITEALARFQSAGAIRKMRGVLEIVERSKLEAVTCCCYTVIQNGYRAKFAGMSTR